WVTCPECHGGSVSTPQAAGLRLEGTACDICQVRGSVSLFERWRWPHQRALNRDLTRAALAGNLPRSEELIRTGAAVDAMLASEDSPKGGSVPREGSTALHIAIARKDLGFVTWLLDH